MFWLLAVWLGAITVVSMVISTATTGRPFPGVWGHASERIHRRGPGVPRPAYAGHRP